LRLLAVNGLLVIVKQSFSQLLYYFANQSNAQNTNHFLSKCSNQHKIELGSSHLRLIFCKRYNSIL